MRVQVVLKLGSCSNAQILVNGDHYVNCMTGNPYFEDPAIVALVTTCKTSVASMRTAMTAPLSDTKFDVVRMARDTVERNFTLLGGEVEEVANDPAIPDSKRIEIVHSAGMEVKEQVRRGRNVFSVKNTMISGKVHLTAQGGAAAHEWQYTDDVINYTNRKSATTTTAAVTDIENLKKATEYAFFHKPVISNTDTSWEGPILLVVS